MESSAGIISMGGYLPAKEINGGRKDKLVSFLNHEISFPVEYIEHIDTQNKLPGTIETNYDGWEKQPWFQAWLARIPAKKRDDPFQGAKERRRVPLDPASLRESVIPHPMLPSDAETLAGALALVNGNVNREDIDLLMVSSQVPDLLLPGNASLVQHKLRLKKAGAYNVDTCCSSFVTMLELASSLVMSGMKKKILIITSYIDSIVNDKSTYYAVNTGDAAVAAVVSAVDKEFGYIASHSISHGSRHDGVIFQRRPPELFKSVAHGHDYEKTFVTFYNQEANREIAINSQKEMTEVVNKLLEKARLSISDIDFFITHQPVQWAGEEWREGLGIPEERFYETFKKYGNIANCAAPVNMLEAVELGLIKQGDIVLMASPGAGENCIAVLQRTSSAVIHSLKNEEK